MSWIKSKGDEKEESLRIFPRQMKKDCWNRAKIVPGRDPDRWRMDPVGNIVCNKLTTCEGCLCHEYDHIIPFSKGGTTALENCQILQTRVNRMKGNQENDVQKLLGYSCDYIYREELLDIVEMSVYGDVKREGKHCRCPSIMEQFDTWQKSKKSEKRAQLEKLPHCYPK